MTLSLRSFAADDDGLGVARKGSECQRNVVILDHNAHVPCEYEAQRPSYCPQSLRVRSTVVHGLSYYTQGARCTCPIALNLPK